MARKKKETKMTGTSDLDGASEAAAPAAVSAAGGEDACATGCCSSGGTGSDTVPATVAAETTAPPPTSSCGSSSEKSAGCCSSDTEKPAAKKASCGSSAAKTSDCCAPKPAVASTGCCAPKPVAKESKSCCPPSDGVVSSCCAPKQVAVAPAKEVKSCCSSKASSCKKSAAAAVAAPTACAGSTTKRVATAPTAATGSGSIETVRLSIGGMTCTGCCTRIEGFMNAQPGIVGVNVSLLTSRGVFEYDPKALAPQDIEKFVTTLGFTATPMPSESLASIVLFIDRERPERAKQVLLGIDGVASVREHHEKKTAVLDPATTGQNSVLVEYDPDVMGARTLARKLSDALGGIHVQATAPRPHTVDAEEEEVAKFASYLFWSCMLTLPVVLVQYVVPLFSIDVQRAFSSELVTGLSWQNLIGLVCATPILLIIAYPIHESAFLALRFGSRITMDVLISLSSFSAYVFSVVTLVLRMIRAAPATAEGVLDETFFEVTALLISLILLGRYIEKIVKARASHSVDALLKIQAKTAILLEKNGTRESNIDVLLVERGDLLKVLPGARVPTDGIVVDGASSVNESMVTGEARKVAKVPGSVVIGGTINAQGVLIVRVTHTINESMLARIVHLVDEAQSSKSAIQSVADVVSSYFTTFIITVAVVMFGIWYTLAARAVIDTNGMAPLPFALRFAITILVISCPCAISLAVPTAIMVATTIGSQFGVLFKGGHALEALNTVDVVMFDKTGTLTTGQLQVVDVHFPTSTDVSHDRTLALLAAAERNSEHAIARAILQYAEGKGKGVASLDAAEFEAVAGCGVRCTVDGHIVRVGSLKWMQQDLQLGVSSAIVAQNLRFQRNGCVVVCLAIDDRVSGLVALRDAPRAKARFVIETLRARSIQPWIVSGDQRETVLAVAAQLGISELHVISDALPHDKVDKVRLLQHAGKRVAFVGDGVNDGPALAMAHVGLAVGAGTDVAIESADVVLVKDDLRDLLNALDLSRATNRLIRWNFTWGFMYNLLMMPIACGALYPAFGWAIPPAFAGLSELFSSVPVILFSLLLNWWRPPFSSSGEDDDTSGSAFVSIDVDKRTPTESSPLLAKK